MPGLVNKPGQESKNEAELLIPGPQRVSTRELGSMAEAAAHCLLKGSGEMGRAVFTEEGHEARLEQSQTCRGGGGSAMHSKSSAWRTQSWPFDLGCLSSPF